jgi:hypothetical protein
MIDFFFDSKVEVTPCVGVNDRLSILYRFVTAAYAADNVLLILAARAKLPGEAK